MPIVEIDELLTPIGALTLVSDTGGLRGLAFGARSQPSVRAWLARRWAGQDALPRTRRSGVDAGGIARRVQAYFAGELDALDTVPLALEGTPFQREVWMVVRQIPVGQTRTYGELARRLGRPLAARAVGAANGANPAALVVPCHRVIGQSGELTGYAYGLERKRWLLAHEGALRGTLPLDVAGL